MASSSVLGAALGARFSYSPSPAGQKNQQLQPIPSRPRRRRQIPFRVGGAAVAVRAQGAAVNPEIRKDEAKVVDSVVVSELSKPLTAYCRCWRSGTFPLCDGSHVKHNKATGDNAGPLLLKK